MEISVLKKGGSLWLTLVNAWDMVKDKMGSIVHSIIDTLSSMLGARGEIERIVIQMESLVQEASVEVEGCVEIAQKLGLKNVDCKNAEVAKVVARISKLGNSMAEQHLKELLLSKVSKVGKVADVVLNIQVGDIVTIDISKVKDYDSHEPYIKLVKREIRRGEGNVRVVSLRGNIAEISGLLSGMDILGGIWVPINSLRKVGSVDPSIAVQISSDEIPIVAKIINSKKAEVAGVYVEGSSEEEMLELFLDEIEKKCNCGAKAEDIMTAAVEEFKEKQLSKIYSWDDVEIWYDDIYILDERYGTEKEFYDDIDSGKVIMIGGPESYSGNNAKKKEAVSPPGWEKTVERMKKHPEIENPWALAYFLKEKGYEPKKKSKKVAQDTAVEDVASDVGSIVSDAADKVEADVKDAAGRIQEYIEEKLDTRNKTAVEDIDILEDVEAVNSITKDLMDELGIDEGTVVDLLISFMQENESGAVLQKDAEGETYMISMDGTGIAVVDSTGKTQIKDKGTGAVKEDRTYTNPAEAVSKLTGEGWKV